MDNNSVNSAILERVERVVEALQDNSVKMGHRVEFDASQVKRALGIAKDKMETYSDMATFLASKRFTANAYIT